MELLIKFTDQSQSFANGVEFGRLLAKMELNGSDPVTNCGFPVRIENKEVIESACEAYGYLPCFGDEHYGEWIQFVGIKKLFTEN